MSIRFHTLSEKKKFQDKLLIKKILKDIISKYNKSVGDINIILVSDKKILKINKEYLKHDYFTDIITFNYNVNNIVSGDLYISFDRIEENAVKYKNPLNIELSRVIIHGILHLLGFDDKTKEQRMKIRLLEQEFLDIIYSSVKK